MPTSRPVSTSNRLPYLLASLISPKSHLQLSLTGNKTFADFLGCVREHHPESQARFRTS